MKKIVLISIIIVLLSLNLGGCLGDKGKFIGTWQFSEGGTITFFDNDTVTITDIHPLGSIQLNGVFTYALSGHNVTFSSRGSIGITITFAYSFPNDTTLVLTSSQVSLTLTKTS